MSGPNAGGKTGTRTKRWLRDRSQGFRRLTSGRSPKTIDLRDGAESVTPGSRSASPRRTATVRRPGSELSVQAQTMSSERTSTSSGDKTRSRARLAAGILAVLAAVLVMFGLADRPEPARFDPTVGLADIDLARERLADAEVVPVFEPGVPYERASYMPNGWADLDEDCINTRNEVLVDQSLTEARMSTSGCQVSEGRWIDPYTGQEFTDPDLVDIDHVVALSAAHRAGAWRLSPEEQVELANDQWNRSTGLAVVESGVNQSKSDRPPQEWLPETRDAQCAYVLRWIAVKDRWNLAFEASEVTVLDEVLDACRPTTG